MMQIVRNNSAIFGFIFGTLAEILLLVRYLQNTALSGGLHQVSALEHLVFIATEMLACAALVWWWKESSKNALVGYLALFALRLIGLSGATIMVGVDGLYLTSVLSSFVALIGMIHAIKATRFPS